MKSNWIVKKALLFFAVYFCILIIAEFSGLKKAVQNHTKHVGSSFFSEYKNGGEVRFENLTKKEDKKLFEGKDILMTLTSKQQKARIKKQAIKENKKTAVFHPIKFAINSWLSFGMLFSFFLTLVIVLPSSWKNKLLLLFSGTLFIELFFCFKLWAALGMQFNKYFSKFEVGSNNETFHFILNHIFNIINFPYFGFVLILIFCLLFIDKKVWIESKENLAINKQNEEVLSMA